MMTVLPFEPRTIAEIRKSGRDVYRLQAVQTDDGPRLSLMVYRLHPDRAIPIRCLGHFHPEVLGDLADGIRAAESLLLTRRCSL